MYGYIALFNGKRTEIYADSQLEAFNKAVEHFKPSKAKKYNVSVHLAELPTGETVTQVITN